MMNKNVQLPFSNGGGEAKTADGQKAARPIVRDYPPRTIKQAKESLDSLISNKQIMTECQGHWQTELDALVEKLKAKYRELSKARVLNPFHDHQELVEAAYDIHCEITKAQKELFNVTDLALKAQLNVIRASENLLVLEAQAKALDAFDALAKGEKA